MELVKEARRRAGMKSMGVVRMAMSTCNRSMRWLEHRRTYSGGIEAATSDPRPPVVATAVKSVRPPATSFPPLTRRQQARCRGDADRASAASRLPAGTLQQLTLICSPRPPTPSGDPGAGPANPHTVTTAGHIPYARALRGARAAHVKRDGRRTHGTNRQNTLAQQRLQPSGAPRRESGSNGGSAAALAIGSTWHGRDRHNAEECFARWRVKAKCQAIWINGRSVPMTTKRTEFPGRTYGGREG